MLSRLKLFPLFLIAALALLLVACGGGSDEDAAEDAATQTAAPDEQASGDGDTAADAGGASDEFVSNGVAVIGRSVEAASATEVTSLSGDVTFDFSTGASAFAGGATFGFQAPGQMHMVLSFEGGDSQSLIDLSQYGDIELLSRDSKFYLNIPFLGGWFEATPASMGESAVAVQDMLMRGSPFDYQAFLAGMGDDVTYVGEEEVAGQTTAHYAFTVDLTNLIGSFADALSAAGDNAVAGQILGSELSGPVSVDLWIGQDDYLPYKMTAAAEITAPDQTTMVMNVAANFGNYNAAVSIPPAPENAQSLEALFAQFGIDPNAQPPAAPTEAPAY